MCEKCAVNVSRSVSDLDGLMELGLSLQNLSAKEVAKAVEDTQQEQGGEDFLSEELILAAIIGIAFRSVAVNSQKEFLQQLEIRGIGHLDVAIDAVRPALANVVTKDTETKVAGLLTAVMSKGSALAGDATRVRGLFGTDTVLKDMVTATKYYTNNYFNRIVVPQLQSIVQEAMLTGRLDGETYTAVREAMSNRLKSVPYWRIVANAAASRGYHYGAVKAGISLGYKGYEIVAVLDDRTTDICRHMDGKKFWLADAEVQVTKTAMAQNDEVKNVAPWMSFDEIENMDANSLKENGFIAPPFHGNCRSTIRFTSV